MFDHVAASKRFYRTVLSVLGVEPGPADAELVEWEDWDISAIDGEHPVTRGLHVGFRAPDRAHVNAFWQAGIDAGCRDDGAPRPRPQYGPTYYGGFLVDPDGNSVEASGDVSISTDGLLLLFASKATNLTPDDRNGGVFLRELRELAPAQLTHAETTRSGRHTPRRLGDVLGIPVGTAWVRKRGLADVADADSRSPRKEPRRAPPIR